jgi:hypothetical protein
VIVIWVLCAIGAVLTVRAWSSRSEAHGCALSAFGLFVALLALALALAEHLY